MSHLELTRVWNWPERLIAVLDEHRAHEFEWGRYDCATLVSSAIEAMTGVDVSVPYRGKSGWKSAKGAAAALKRGKVSSIHELTGQLFRDIPPSMAQRGDLAYGEVVSPIASPWIVVGTEMITRDLEKGWLIQSTSFAKTAYKVG